MTRSRSVPGIARAIAFAAALAGCAGATASPSSAPASPAASAGIASPIVGTWTTTITPDDLAAAGIADPNLQRENSGRFTFTFSPDGTWTQVQESIGGEPLFNPVFRGTWVLDGSTLVATTTFPTEYADSGLHFTWSVDADGLHLDLLDPPDPILPVVMERHPWARVP